MPISKTPPVRRWSSARTLLSAIALAALTSSAASAQGVFTLTSSQLKSGATMGLTHVFDGMGCSGQNVSPELSWSNTPAGTKSFAVTVFDPDAPTGGSGWWHWMAYNIPATATSLPAGAGDRSRNALPAGALHGPTDFGAPLGYGGPCPPVGDKPHRYIFSVYALKVSTLAIPAGSTSAFVGYNLNANALAKASFTVYYGR